MTIQKYRIQIVDKTTGEIYLDETTKSVDLHSSSPLINFTQLYIHLLCNHPSACLSIVPIRPDYIEKSIFV